MSAHNPQVTYTLSDIRQQEAAIDAIDGRVVLLAQLLEQTTIGSIQYWTAKANLLEMQAEAQQMRLDLEAMKRGLRS